MLDKLSMCEVRIGIQELTPIDDDALESVMSDIDGKDAIMRVFTIGKCSFLEGIDFYDHISYLKDLADKVGKIKGVIYTDEEKTMCALYVIQRYIYTVDDKKQIEDARNAILLYEDAISVETDSDVMWLIRQTVKYKLLDLYASWPTDEMYDKMKALTIELKSQKTKFNEIQENLWEQYFACL